MNVMTEAHKAVKAVLTNAPVGVTLNYRSLLKAALTDMHRKNKEMKPTKTLTVDQMFAIKHFEDCIARTLEQFEKLGVNDYYVALANNVELNDYTLLQHKDVNDKQSPLGWATYSTAIVTSPAQADEYVKAFPGTCKLHAQTHLSNVIQSFRDMLENV
jgi:hypothetical protein